MKVLLCQCDIEWGNVMQNLYSIEQLIDEEKREVDLVILPEMFSTGFCTEPEGVAENGESDSLEWMRKIANSKNVAVVGSVATVEGGNYYNRLYFVYPEGNYIKYDKRHLFTYGGEHLHYTPGGERVVAEYRGWRILLQICYDLRFPVFARNRGDYDLAVYIASWPSSRLYAWNTLLRARAIENIAYVAGVNRVGTDPKCSYSGGTLLADFMGGVLGEASPEKINTLYVELDMNALKEFRSKFPALNDRDNFVLEG